jgi:probable phosphoglycerate mutase
MFLLTITGTNAYTQKNFFSAYPDMSQPTRVSFVRHGQVENPEYIFYGRRPYFKLSAPGLREAGNAARRLQHLPLAAVFSSPLLRARQTAREILKLQPQLRLRISGLLTEVLSVYEGGTAREVDMRRGDIYSGAPAAFEQPADIFRRIQQFMASVRKKYPGQHTAAITHGDIIVFMVLWAKGRALTPGNKLRLTGVGISGGYPANGSITTFTYMTDNPEERPRVSYLKP